MAHRIADIARALGGELCGEGEITVSGAAEPQDAGPESLAIATTPGFAARLGAGRARAALIGPETDWRAAGLEAAIIVPRGRLALAHLTALMGGGDALPTDQHPSAVIGADAALGAGVGIGPFTVIGAGAHIGADTRFGAHVTIAPGAQIAGHCRIHDGVRIGQGVRIGPGTVVHPNAVIGADGFSFVTEEQSQVEAARAEMGQTAQRSGDPRWHKIGSLGGVDIGAEVEIGAGSTVDAGTIRATRIGQGTKIDNLVQVGHNVTIGDHCLLCAQSGVAGSASIGDRCVIGGKAGVSDNVTLGADVVLGSGSIVLSNVPAGRIMLGYPAVRIETHVESYKALRRLPRLLRAGLGREKPVPKRGETD